jgi:hypothetical protein
MTTDTEQDNIIPEEENTTETPKMPPPAQKVSRFGNQ